MSDVLRLTDVTKEYPGNPPVEVLHSVSLVIEQGEFVAIVGPSGSGKSTLLNLIGTLERPTSGTVHVAGKNVADQTDAELAALRSRKIGFVFQQFFLLDGQSALDNVADGLLYTGTPIKQRRSRALEVLDVVGLSHRVRHLPNELSGGERQRVAIARALVGRPSVILADEPTGNLDSRSGASIMNLLRSLHEAGNTIVVITHDRDLASQFDRQIGVLDGEIEFDQRHEVAIP